jgi:hypothetical protein
MTMMRSSMITFSLTMLLFGQFQQCEGLALVPRSVKTALLSRFVTPRSAPQTTAMMYAHEIDYAPSESMKSGVITDTTGFDSDDSMAAYKSEMLDLVYERSMQRLLE